MIIDKTLQAYAAGVVIGTTWNVGLVLQLFVMPDNKIYIRSWMWSVVLSENIVQIGVKALVQVPQYKDNCCLIFLLRCVGSMRKF